ncbi:MAG: hypothetical protein PW843_21905 [Azospirillaceae bacterium]|nr:hypothetical protein [Azospirillaceae bacterium]
MSLRVAVRRSLLILPVLASAATVSAAWAQSAPSAAPPATLIPSEARPAAPVTPPIGGAKPGAFDDTNCSLPTRAPAVPDGRTAPEADIRKAHEDLQAYVASGQSFVRCVDDQVALHPDKLTVARYLQMSRLQDIVINNMQVMAARFNEQLRVFKARTPGAAAPAAKPAGK